MTLRNAFELLATEQGQTDQLAKSEEERALLALIEGKNFATEATLALLNAKDFASQTTLALALAKLNDIFSAVDGLEISAQNIDISNTTIGLQTDALESLLQQIRDNFTTQGVAKETTLQLVLTELSQKLETNPSDFPDASGLAKAEQIRALLAGTLAVSGAFYPGVQAVSAADLDVRDLLLSQDSVRQTQRPMLSYVAAQSSVDGTVTAADVTSPNRIRLLRLDAGSKPSNLADSFCTVTIALGGVNKFVKELQVGEPIGGQVCIEGAAGEDLTVLVTGIGTVQFNLRYEVFQ